MCKRVGRLGRNGERVLSMEKKKKIINVALVVVAVTVIAVMGLFVKVSDAADKVAVLKAFGMTCGSCSDKIVKALSTEQGVGSVVVNVDSGEVVVNFDSKQTAPERLAAKVTATGYGSSVTQVLTTEEYAAASGNKYMKLPRKGCKCCS